MVSSSQSSVQTGTEVKEGAKSAFSRTQLEVPMYWRARLRPFFVRKKR